MSIFLYLGDLWGECENFEFWKKQTYDRVI